MLGAAFESDSEVDGAESESGGRLPCCAERDEKREVRDADVVAVPFVKSRVESRSEEIESLLD